MKESKFRNNDFEDFFINNYPKTKAFAQRLIMSEQDAEDIAQDIFMKLLDCPEIWLNHELRNKYLYTMTRNHIFNFIKHKKIERRHQQELLEKYNITDEFGLEDLLHAQEIALLAIYTTDQMPERRQEIFKMSRFAGKSNAEISQTLGLSVRTVERHLYLALSDLKKALLFHFSIE